MGWRPVPISTCQHQLRVTHWRRLETDPTQTRVQVARPMESEIAFEQDADAQPGTQLGHRMPGCCPGATDQVAGFTADPQRTQDVDAA